MRSLTRDDIEAIRQISIKNFLEQNGIRPARDGGSYGLYSALYREDKNPSMKVNYQDNTWCDFATGEQGNIIDLVKKINNTDFMGAVQVLQSQSGLSAHVTAAAPAQAANSHEEKFIVHQVMELRNPALLQYLQERKIDIDIAKKLCKELYYEVRTGEQSKRYFGIGFKNDKGGWEIRNKYFKGCTSKDISTTNRSSTTCRVFEGFMDYLSFLTLDKQGYTNSEWIGNNNENVVVLNSIINVDGAKEFLAQHTTNICYLDNDDGGKRTLQTMKDMKLPVINASDIYPDHKDLNEMLMSLPQRQQPKLGAGLKM
jgi:hypothetical protein